MTFGDQFVRKIPAESGGEKRTENPLRIRHIEISLRTQDSAITTAEEGLRDTMSKQLHKDCYHIRTNIQYCVIEPKLWSSTEAVARPDIHPVTI